MPGCDYDLCLPCWESGAIEEEEDGNDEGGCSSSGASSSSGVLSSSGDPASAPASSGEDAVLLPASLEPTSDDVSAAATTTTTAATTATPITATAALQPAAINTVRSFTVEVEAYGSSYSGTLRIGLTAKDPTTCAQSVPAMLGALGNDTVYLSTHDVRCYV